MFFLTIQKKVLGFQFNFLVSTAIQSSEYLICNNNLICSYARFTRYAIKFIVPSLMNVKLTFLHHYFGKYYRKLMVAVRNSYPKTIFLEKGNSNDLFIRCIIFFQITFLCLWNTEKLFQTLSINFSNKTENKKTKLH